MLFVVFARSLRDLCIVLADDLFEASRDLYLAVPHAVVARQPTRTVRTILTADEDSWTDGTD